MNFRKISETLRHAAILPLEVALGITILSGATYGCSSKELAQSSLQDYCDVARGAIEGRTVFTKSGLLDVGAIYSLWNEKNPTDTVQNVLDDFYTKEQQHAISSDPDAVTLEDYRRMMADSSTTFELAPPQCDVLLAALISTNRRAARLNFVDEVCQGYDQLKSEMQRDSFGPSQHDEVLRAAFARAIDDARYLNEGGKAFVEAILGLSPTLRGKFFSRNIIEFQGRELEYGDPCFDLQLDVERLHKEHLEKQGIETP